MDKWKAELLVKMRMNGISQKRLAAHLGLTPQYVSMIFSGAKSSKKAETSFTEAVNSIISHQVSP